MNIARKISALTTTVAILTGCLLVVFVAHRDSSYRRDSLILAASSLVASQPHLQSTLYFKNSAQMQRLLDEALALSPAVKYAALRDSHGAILLSRAQPWAESDPFPRFIDLRSGLSPLDEGQRSEEGGGVPDVMAPLEFLTLGERTLFLSLPVTSVLNPITPNLEPIEFAQAIIKPEEVRSLFVSGYIEVGISNTMLWRQSLPTITLYGGVALVLILMIALAARIFARRISAPVRELANVAYDIATGKRTDPLPIRGSGEIREIANVLNGIITGLHNYTTQMESDKKVLSLRVNEQTERLTQRSEELDQAVQKVGETRDKLRHMAYFDELTSLPNRRLFTEQLTLLLRLAGRSKERLGLLQIGIDNFKRVNDSLGPKAGDKLLREMADRLAAAVRDSDVLHRRAPEDGSIMDLSRVGGDEFTVVLNQVEDAQAARAVAERILARLTEPVRIGHHELIVTATIGIALSPDHADGVESLLTAAGIAMLTGKKAGRNRITVYDKSMDNNNRGRLQLETDLRNAIERDQLLLHYQPQVHSDTGAVVGVEALVRWLHPTEGLIPPFRWIPLAEELGIIDDVGAWVLGEACRSLVKLREEGFSLPKVSVNVSALQFSQMFAAAVEQTLHETGLPPDSLELELTESIMINDEESTVKVVEAFKELGVRLSIDDFGTGYSSLSYLSRFPLDCLKIDRSFVLGLSKGSRNKELVKGIISLGHSLGLDIVVEGVERLEELQFFREENARVIQGFLFSAPVPIEQLRSVLKEGHFAGQLQVLDRILDHSLVTTMEEA